MESERLRQLSIEDPGLKRKWESLISLLKPMGAVVVAFSGGVDSSFLLYVAHMVLGDRVVAVIARSPTYPSKEVQEAEDFAKTIGVRSIVIESEEMGIEEFKQNPPDRCYHCKYELFDKLNSIKESVKAKFVLDGSNLDDESDYRPGLMAAMEWGVCSPLMEAGLRKNDIRRLSQILDLPTWDKPSYACLSSRIPYGEEITVEKLKMIETAEEILRDLGFNQVRVRYHKEIARIEVGSDEIEGLLEKKTRRIVNSELKKVGFKYVTVDLEGYRTGSMNEGLYK